MVIAYQSYRLGMPNLCHSLDTRTGLGGTEHLPGQDILVCLGMQFGESLAELKLFAIDTQRTESALYAGRQTVGTDTEEIAYPCLLQLQMPRHAV